MNPRNPWTVLGVALGLLVACAKAPPPSPPPAPSASLEPPPAPLQKWPYWRAAVVDLHPSPERAASEPDARPPAWLAAGPWRGSSSAILAKVREDGLAVHKTRSAEVGLGAFYEERARLGAPLLVTADALFAVAHLALTSAAAAVETRLMRAELSTLLRRLDARLGAEVVRARPDLLEGYRIARTTVAVALTLFDPAYVAPADLEGSVASETTLVRAHAGVFPSPLFGVPFDYSVMTPRGTLAAAGDPRAGAFQAAEWLASAPFFFEGEGAGAKVNVGAARGLTRAALLLARLLVKDGDAAASTAATRMGRVDRFALGDPDELSPADVADLAAKSGIDLRGGGDIISAAKLDHFRHEASRRADGTDDSTDGGREASRAPSSMRLVPFRTTPDDRVLQALVTPFLGPLLPEDAGSGGLPPERRLPGALDVGAWLGSGTATAALAERGDTRYAGFDRTLSSLVAGRPKDELAIHASVYGSFLEAGAVWLRPSAAEPVHSPSPRDAEGRRKLQTALTAWTLLRHDALPFAHDEARALARPTRGGAHPDRVFVEPHPEAIASLLGAVQQLHSGLHALDALADDSPANSVLAEAESLLTLALEASVRSANGDPTAATLEPQLAEIPSRIAALEAATHSAAEPIVVDVHVDVARGRILEEGTGTLEEILVRVHDPVTRRPVLVVGALIPHVELVEVGWTRLGDAAWRARLASGKVPDPEALFEPEIVPSN